MKKQKKTLKKEHKEEMEALKGNDKYRNMMRKEKARVARELEYETRKYMAKVDDLANEYIRRLSDRPLPSNLINDKIGETMKALDVVRGMIIDAMRELRIEWDRRI